MAFENAVDPKKIPSSLFECVMRLVENLTLCSFHVYGSSVAARDPLMCLLVKVEVRVITQSWARLQNPTHLLPGREGTPADHLSPSSISYVCSETTPLPMENSHCYYKQHWCSF